MSESASLNKLRWRCRRGTMELDLMLMRYLERRYVTADAYDQQAFIALLDREDNELIRYLLGENQDYPEGLAEIIQKIRALPA